MNSPAVLNAAIIIILKRQLLDVVMNTGFYLIFFSFLLHLERAFGSNKSKIC